MNFSKLRHRIIFLKPMEITQNSMHENIPVWMPYRAVPFKKNLEIEDGEVYFKEDCDGNAICITKHGEPYAHEVVIKDYAVWAAVSPMTGREYEEAQKLRAETTFKVITRYFPNITTDMKILHRERILDIVSVLNIDERNTELQIVAKERDVNGKENG